jgi:hypothetical protein
MGDTRGDAAAATAFPRAKWWITFALLATLIGLWSVATPLFAGADEPAHVVRAAAVGRGEFTGRTPDADNLDGYVYVELPAIYESAGRHVGCFAGQADRDASCFHFDGSETTKPVITEAGRHPPAYYAVVGAVSRAWPNAPGATYLMRAATVLIAALFLTIAIGALSRTADPRLVLVGFAVALTPMVLAFTGTVNPSALEIAAALATWSCALVLVAEVRTGDPPDPRLVTQLGVSAAAFVLARQTSMFWLALVGLIVAGLLGRDALRRLWQSTTARIWGVIVVVCAGAQLAWITFAKGLDLSVLPSADPTLSNHEIVRRTIGRSSIFYLEMLGRPGWLDTTLPGLTYLLWTAVLGALVLLAVGVGARRYLTALLVATGITVLVPILLEAWQARSYGFYWQGRYTLPFAVGVPLLAAFALQSENGARVFRARLIPALGGLVLVAQVLAYYQALRRWSVGADGPVLYWLDPTWNAPIPQVALILTYGAAFSVFVVWLLGTGRWSATPVRTSAP